VPISLNAISQNETAVRAPIDFFRRNGFCETKEGSLCNENLIYNYYRSTPTMGALIEVTTFRLRNGI